MLRTPILFLVLCLTSSAALAADAWKELKSAHFTVWSNARDGDTRELLWQVEQVRSALASLWPWMKVDGRPVRIIVARDEKALKALVPEYWERKEGARLASLWLSTPGQTFLVLRADLLGDSHALVNPYQSAYFSYSNVVLARSLGSSAPPWVRRGLAAVLGPGPRVDRLNAGARPSAQSAGGTSSAVPAVSASPGSASAVSASPGSASAVSASASASAATAVPVASADAMASAAACSATGPRTP